MGRRSSDRPRIDDRPPLQVKALMEVVESLVKSRGMKSCRVAYKTNAKGSTSWRSSGPRRAALSR
jgi:hypothetical protein